MPREILLVGLPRSGTSWVGAVLGSSPSVEYLREPITQTWLDEGIGTPTVDLATDVDYAAVVDRVLADTGSRRLIKEVNPYLIPHVVDHYPKMAVVFLHRHPCAVALSYKERRWTRLDLEQRFNLQKTGDFWYDHGRFQSRLLRPAMPAIRRAGHIVSYEDIATDPVGEFERLAKTLGLEWGEASRSYLASTMSDAQPGDPYALTRDAAAARDRWVTSLTDEQKRAVLRGYRQYRSKGMPRPT